MVSPVMRDLSTYVAGALGRPLPTEVVERAKIHLVDTFAAMLSGSRLVPGRKVLAFVKSQVGRPEASVVGTRLVTTATQAALANGMFAHADETDDTHPPSRTHPGASVVPAVLAIGQRNRLPGKAVLRAMVLGYDVCSRLLLAINEATFRYSGHHASSFGGVFGAAAAAGALLRLDAQQVRHMLSYTAEQAAGLYSMHRDNEHIEKAFAMGGMPAHNGTAAALMVAHGFTTGVEDVFSGERDFFHTFAPEADRKQLSAGLGRRYEILRGGIKRWTVGGPIQGPLHVLHELIRTHNLRARDVKQLVMRMPDKEFETVNNRSMPNICVQHLLAVMLVDGTMTFKAAHELQRMKDPAVLETRKRIRVIGDSRLTDAQRRWRAVIELTLHDGRKLKHQTMAAKGSFEDPVNRREEEEKALDLIAPVLGKSRSGRLLEALWKIDHLGDVRSLQTLLRA